MKNRKLQKKPKGRSRLVIVFECGECGKENTVYENYEELSDPGDGDGLDYYCKCSSYYKKIHHVFMLGKEKESYYEKLKKN